MGHYPGSYRRYPFSVISPFLVYQTRCPDYQAQVETVVGKKYEIRCLYFVGIDFYGHSIEHGDGNV